MAATEQKISRTALLAMVVGGMVGAGIFALPSRFGGVTGPVGDQFRVWRDQRAGWRSRASTYKA